MNKNYFLLVGIILLIALVVANFNNIKNSSLASLFRLEFKKDTYRIEEQKVKTVKITKTYRDVIAGTPIGQDNFGRIVDVITLNSGTEVLSAILNVTEGFVLPPEQGVSMSLLMFGEEISSGSVNLPTLINTVGSPSRKNIFSFILSQKISLIFTPDMWTTDLANLTSGVVDIYLSYIEY